MGRTWRPPRPIACVLAVLFHVSAASAIEPCELAKLTPSDDPVTCGKFGHSVAIGDHIVVGSHIEYAQVHAAGAAYVYEREGTTWIERAKIFASDARFGLHFGYSVATDSDLIAVGALGTEPAVNLPGAAYVFRRKESNCCVGLATPGCDHSECQDQICSVFPTCCESIWDESCAAIAELSCEICRNPWVEEAKLVSSGSSNLDRFGESISISGEFVLVGAPGLRRAYIFRREGTKWVEEAELAGSDSHPQDGYGESVSINDGLAAVGARLSDRLVNQAGATYVYRRDGKSWIEEAILAASEPAAFDFIGLSVAVGGDTIAVAGDGAWIFRYVDGNWVEESKIVDTPSTTVALEDDLAVVGQSFIVSGGQAHVFRRVESNWVKESSFQSSDVASANQFGISVDVAGGLAVIGSNAKAAYVFAVTDDCNTNGLVDICEIADDASDDCDDNLVPDECQPDCDGNGVADSCEIADGTSIDCDDNLVPDECQPDCDGNGVADSCDIANGTLEDVNANGIPDACEGLIPTVSNWGLIATALLLLVCARLYFGRQRRPASYRTGESV